MQTRAAAFYLIFCLLFSAKFLFGATTDGVIRDGEYPNQLILAGGSYTLYWKLEGDTAHFGIVAKTSGWVALGIDPEKSMQGADMIFGWVEAGSRVSVLDAFATGPFGPHPKDDELGGSQDVRVYGGREQDGVTVIEFERALRTKDKYDKPITPGSELKILWAYGKTDSINEIHDAKGSALLAAADLAQSTAAPTDFYTLLVPVHAVMRSTTFLLLFVGMFFPRYFKKKKWWLKTHRVIGIAGTVLALLGVGVAVFMIATTSKVHLRVVHAYFGLITILLMLYALILGSVMLKIRKNAKLNRAIHRWVGRITLLGMLASIVLGLIQAGYLRF